VGKVEKIGVASKGRHSMGKDAMRLLIAEDDKALGLFLSRGLEADGHRVHLAYDGAAAV
jgi:CheY-like chemotaxis protein